MPQELLRDVLRTDDAAGRSRRRWVLFPTSVAVHAVARRRLLHHSARRGSHDADAGIARCQSSVGDAGGADHANARRSLQRASDDSSTSGAPTEAPSKLAPEVPPVAEIPAPGALEGPPGVSVGVPDASGNWRARGQASCAGRPASRSQAAQGWRLDPRTETNRGLRARLSTVCDQREGRRRSRCWRHSSTSRVG